MRGDPLSNLFGDVPGGVVTDQHPNLLAERFELLGAPRKEASSYPAHRATIHKARPHLLKLGHIKPVAGDGLGIRVVFFDRLLYQATVLSVGALVHLGENNPSVSDLERTAHIRPLERLGHRSVEVLDELEDAPVQILHGGEAAPLEESARQNREP